jgi:hypothetical protein
LEDATPTNILDNTSREKGVRERERKVPHSWLLTASVTEDAKEGLEQSRRENIYRNTSVNKPDTFLIAICM